MIQLNCDYCGRVISGKYFTDYWGKNYCASHLKTLPQCDYCGRFFQRNTNRRNKFYTDGRTICETCQPTAVTQRETGLKLLHEVRDELALIGIKISPFNPDFALISRSKMKQIDRKQGERQGYAVFNRKVSQNDTVQSYRMQVLILEGLPEASFISTAAHELMHIWFFSHNITDITPLLAEGSCNMASYLVLKRQKTPEAGFLIKGLFEDKNKIYGIGFRKIHRLVDKIGITGWLQYAKSHKRI